MVKADGEILKKTFKRALSGKDAHVKVLNAVEGLDWRIAGKRLDACPHSIYQLVNHIVYWQEWMVKWLDGENPAAPKHAAGSWPGGVEPANPEGWEEARRRLGKALGALSRRCGEDLLSKHGRKSRIEMLQAIAQHTSYHVGQVVLLRQLMGAWPPPSGGVTW
jgi:uncharacterized damage-inducible protein DinB